MIRRQVLKHFLRAREGQRGSSKGDVKIGAMEKDRRVRVIEKKKIRR